MRSRRRGQVKDRKWIAGHGNHHKYTPIGPDLLVRFGRADVSVLHCGVRSWRIAFCFPSHNDAATLAGGQNTGVWRRRMP